MKELIVVLLLITVMLGKAFTRISGTMSPEELLKNPPEPEWFLSSGGADSPSCGYTFHTACRTLDWVSSRSSMGDKNPTVLVVGIDSNITISEVNRRVSLPNTTIVLSKNSTTQKDINVVFLDVQNINSSWILHDLDLFIINCTLVNARFYLTKGSTPNTRIVDIKNSIIWQVKVMIGYKIYIEDGKMQRLEAKESKVVLTRVFLSPESFVISNNCDIKINNMYVRLNEIHLVHSNLLVTNSVLGHYMDNSRIWVEESNITFQNSMIHNVQLIVTDDKTRNNLLIENSVFRAKKLFLSDNKCVLSTSGIGNITIYKSKFFLKGNVGYKTIFNISHAAHINVVDSVFETTEVPQFYISSGKYTFLTRRSIFRRGNITLLSNQSYFMVVAVTAGIIEIFSSDVRHNDVIGIKPRSKRTGYRPGVEPIRERQSRDEKNSTSSFLSIITAASLLVPCYFLVCMFCRRKTVKSAKRFRENDAFLCHSHTTDGDFAYAIVKELEEKYQLKLFVKERDFIPGRLILENISDAVRKSNHAVVVLSMMFLECTFCRQMLWACLIEHQKDPSFQLFIILTQKKRSILKEIRAFLYENKYEDMYYDFEKQLIKIIARNRGFAEVIEDLVTVENDCNEKFALFARMESILSKNKCLWFNDPKLYEKLFQYIKTQKPENNTIRQTTKHKTLSKDTPSSSDEITIENDPADTLIVENSEQFCTNNDEDSITNNHRPTGLQQTAKSRGSNNYYSNEGPTSKSGKKNGSMPWKIMDSIPMPHRSNVRPQPDEEALINDDTSCGECPNSPTPGSAFEEYMSFSSNEYQNQNPDLEKSEFSANDLENPNSIEVVSRSDEHATDATKTRDTFRQNACSRLIDGPGSKPQLGPTMTNKINTQLQIGAGLQQIAADVHMANPDAADEHVVKVQPADVQIINTPHADGDKVQFPSATLAIIDEATDARGRVYRNVSPLARWAACKGQVLNGTTCQEMIYCSATFHKGYKLYCGIKINGKSAVLQGPKSASKLHIPEGVHGFISGHAHTDPTLFLNVIPESECLVSPIVEYNCFFRSNSHPKGLFIIKVPHCIQDRKLFQHIRVRHGDIYNKTPFYEKCTFTVDEKFINITTSTFSQFICTVCSQSCGGNPKAFIFGRITPVKYIPVYAELRIYMCSPLYDILDFEQRLVQEEQKEKRSFLQKRNVQWEAEVTHAQFLYIGAQTLRWNPRRPIIGRWFPQTRRLVQKRKLSELTDMMFCQRHACRSGPTEVAHFDFELPETCVGASRDGVPFSGMLEMCIVQGKAMLCTHFYMCPDELEIKSSNEDHKVLRNTTRDTITNDLELIDFGLQLDLPPSMVKQKLRDYPRSIETASYMVVSEWWDSCGITREEKYRLLQDAVHSMGKRCTAKKLGNILQQKGLAYPPTPAPTFPLTGSHHLEVNDQAFIESNPLHQIGATQLAISNAEEPVVHEVSGNSFRIVEITDEDEEHRSNSANGNNYDDGGEFLREVSVSLKVALNPGSGTKPQQVDSNMLEMKSDDRGTIAQNVDLEISFSGNSNQKYLLKTPDIAVNSLPQGNREEVNNNNGEIEKEACKKKLNGEDKSSRSDKSDSYEYQDMSANPMAIPVSGLFNATATPLCNHGFTPDLSVDIDLDDPDVVDHLLPEVHIRNTPTGVVNGQTGTVNGQTEVGNGQTRIVNGQTVVGDGQTGVVNGQTGVVSGQTDVDNSQTGVVKGQTDVMKGQTGLVNGQTGVVNGQTGAVNDQTGPVNGQTEVGNGQTGVVNSQTGVLSGQIGVANDQTEVVTIQTGLMNGEIGDKMVSQMP